TDQRFIGALVAAASLVAGGVEVVFLADDLVTIDWYRMNTVFKFYNQVWVLFALAGAASIALMLDRIGATLRVPAGQARLGIGPTPAFVDGDEEEVVAPPAQPPLPGPSHSVPRWAVAGV